MAVPGLWTIFYDWACDGSYSYTSLTIKEDGTFTTGEGSGGEWSQVAGMLMLIFAPSGTTYAGNLASKSVTGIQRMGYTAAPGCFYMLQKGVPTPPTELAGERVTTKPDVAGN